MTPENKPRVQGLLFDLLVTMDPTVGDIVEIGFGLAYMTLMQHHQGDAALSAGSMREAMNQCLDQALRIVKPPMGIVHGGKLDS